jgi:thiol-disulfide isomerase/thioredoxin
VDDDDGICRNYVWSICVSIKCKVCTCEMQHVSQGLTNYEWYKDYYCPTCKKLIVILDKDQKTNNNKIIERNF